MFTLVKTNGKEEIISCTVSENRNELLKAIKLDATNEISNLTEDGEDVEFDPNAPCHDAIIYGDGYMYYTYDIVKVTPIEQFGK